MFQDAIDAYNRIRQLRQDKFLTEVRATDLSEHDVIVMLSCGDCDRFPDIWEHHRKTHGCRIHSLTINGGAIRLSDQLPQALERHADEILMEEIFESVGLKQASVVGLGSHYPCGKARAWGMTVDQVLAATLRGRQRLKEARPSLPVYAFFHVAGIDGKGRSYIIDHRHMVAGRIGQSLIEAP